MTRCVQFSFSTWLKESCVGWIITVVVPGGGPKCELSVYAGISLLEGIDIVVMTEPDLSPY